MSEKKAKQTRKANRRVILDFYGDGSMNITGFPNEFDAAMRMGHAITRAIAKHFVDAAFEGRLQKTGAVDQPRIIRPRVTPN